MKGIVLQVYEDSSGTLYFSSDIPDRISSTAEKELISTLREAFSRESKTRINDSARACIRQLAFGVAMCSPDKVQFKSSFREDVQNYMK